MVATKRRFDPNLQRMRVFLKGKAQRAPICTKCLRPAGQESHRSTPPDAGVQVPGTVTKPPRNSHGVDQAADLVTIA
jgi:hypothetical protein